MLSKGPRLLILSSAEFLQGLYRMRRDCLPRMAKAEKSGDYDEVMADRMHLRRLNKMIERRGGRLDA